MVQVKKAPRKIEEIEELANAYLDISLRLQGIAENGRGAGLSHIDLRLGTLNGRILEKIQDTIESVAAQARNSMRRQQSKKASSR